MGVSSLSRGQQKSGIPFYKVRQKGTFGLTHLILLVGGIIWMYPFLWMLGSSLKTNADFFDQGLNIFPRQIEWSNYPNAWNEASFGQFFGNTVIVAGSTVLLVLLFTAMAGYALARTEFPGKTWLYRLVLAGLAVPQTAVVIPLHRMFADWGLHNSYPGLILPGLAAPFGVFLMTQYFKAIPRDLEEAALLDNASRWTVFTRVILPLSLPAQATLGIVTFLGAWNDYLWPLITATQSDHYTLTLGLASTQTNFAQSEGLGFLMAQAVFAAAPVLVLYAFFQQYIVAAVAGTRVRQA